MITLNLDDGNADYPQAVQSEIRCFDVPAKFVDAWNTGLETLGRPQVARLTTFEQMQYLDIYFQ